MSLTHFRTLGRSGLVVSPLCLGTMTFGPGGWGADEAASRAIFDAYRDAGGNFIDTADIYTGGASEQFVGKFVKASGARDAMVVATKFAFNGSSSPLTATQSGGGNPNAGGAGAKNIHRALDASLQRLGMDYVDMYWMHIWDGVTPAEEVVQTLGDLVRAGKIRYFGFSDMPAWYAMKAATIAAERRVPGPIAMQLEYSLVARDIESEHLPAAREAGMAVMPVEPARRRLPHRQIPPRGHRQHRPTKRCESVRQQQIHRPQLGHPRHAQGGGAGTGQAGGAGRAGLDPGPARRRLDDHRRQ